MSKIGWPIKTLIQVQCQIAEAKDVPACQEGIAKKLEEEFDKSCRRVIPANVKRREACVSALAQTLWNDHQELKSKLNGKTTAEVIDGLPQSLFDFVKGEALKHKPAPPPTPPPPPAETQKSSQDKSPAVPVVWEEALGRIDDKTTGMKFQFTHEKEWRRVEMEINGETLEWYYWLQLNADGSDAVSWSMEKKDSEPAQQDPHLTFHLQEDRYPANLVLQSTSNHSIQLVLK